MANAFNHLDKSKPRAPRASICDQCSSGKYCRNRAPGMLACENFNKFPSSQGDEHRW